MPGALFLTPSIIEGTITHSRREDLMCQNRIYLRTERVIDTLFLSKLNARVAEWQTR